MDMKDNKKNRYKFAGLAAALVLAAAGGGAYTAGTNAGTANAEPAAVEATQQTGNIQQAVNTQQAENTQQAVNTQQTDNKQKAETTQQTEAAKEKAYTFRNDDLLMEHYDKHGREMGFASAAEYEAAASRVVNDPRALHKLEAEDGDDVYYLEDTNEFVIVSKRGYIRTYFYPNAGRKYFDRQ